MKDRQEERITVGKEDRHSDRQPSRDQIIKPWGRNISLYRQIGGQVHIDDRYRDRPMDRNIDMQTKILTYKYKYGHIDRSRDMDKNINRQIDGQIDRWIDRQIDG